MRVSLAILFAAVLFLASLHFTSQKIGKSFPGYLTFQNGVVGAFYLPHWSGAKSGIHYHDLTPSPLAGEGQGEGGDGDFFTKKDFLLVVILPSVTGLLFLLLGASVSPLLPSVAARRPFFFFHLLVGVYLILSPDFHLTYRFVFLHLLVFAMIPAPMIHFALAFPENSRLLRYKLFAFIPYALSLMLAIPYLYFFLKNPRLWIFFEYLVVATIVIGYLFWIACLLKTLRRPQLEFDRVIVRSLLLGQLVGFMIPCIAVITVFLGGISLPLNLAAPITLLFPISVFIGIVLGRLQQNRMELVQVEKRAALGSMFAGLTHELNNPLTFIYSSIEPLKDLLKQKEVSPKEISELVDLIEEGAERAKGIIDNFRFFSARDRQQEENFDLHEVIEKSIQLLAPKWKDRVEVVRHYGKISKISGFPHELGQVFVNILANACESIRGKGMIEIETLEGANGIQISIRDTGSGVPKEIRDRIFDPFFTTKSQGEGTGLGLAISLEIVKKHHGKIDVKSEVGKGTEFVITLPL